MLDGPGWQKRDAFLNGREEAVGYAGVQVDVAVEGGAEAVEEGDGADPRCGGKTGAAVRQRAESISYQPLDSSRKVRVRAVTAVGRSARKTRRRFGTKITHCRTGTGGITW